MSRWSISQNKSLQLLQYRLLMNALCNKFINNIRTHIHKFKNKWYWMQASICVSTCSTITAGHLSWWIIVSYVFVCTTQWFGQINVHEDLTRAKWRYRGVNSWSSCYRQMEQILVQIKINAWRWKNKTKLNQNYWKIAKCKS